MKIKPEDFSSIPDEDLQHYTNIFSSQINTKNNILSEEYASVLFASRTRRHSGQFNGEVITEENNVDKLYDLTKKVLNEKIRLQIACVVSAAYHWIGFDINCNQQGVLQIICVESAGNDKYQEILQKLLKKLQADSVAYEIIACKTKLQKDGFNCLFFVYAILAEFSKDKSLFDKLKSSLEFEPGKINYLETRFLPKKIIQMGQSTNQMREQLLAAHVSVQEVESIINKRKDYIVERRYNIGQRIPDGDELFDSVQDYRQNLRLVPKI